MNKMIQRHTYAGIFIHWFNAVCWFWLLLTGIGLIKNEALQPLGPWYPRLWREIMGSGENLLAAHWGVGAVWAVVWLLYLVVYLTKLVLPFIKGIVTFQFPRDLEWLVKKNIQMVLGHKLMATFVSPLGMDGRIPDQDYYNVGQKAAAIPMILGGFVLMVTGAIMVLSNRVLGPEYVALVQWSITIHYIMAALTLAVLIIHIFMAAISKEERPAFISMFTGTVPDDYAYHHHRLWYEQINKEKAHQE